MAAILTTAVSWAALAFVAAAAAAPPRPVILVPGFSGVQLREVDGGRLEWGSTARLFLPRDGGERLALSLTGEDRRPPLEPAGPVERIGLGPLYSVDVYDSMLETLAGAGYRRGELGAPGPDETLFVFGYDWRASNVDAARRLADDLRRLRAARGGAPLVVDVVCHSNAARLVRWLLKYGDATLEEAEAGRGRPLEGLRVEHLILIGAANGGSIKSLLFFERGRRYAPLGRLFLPETVFTFPGLFEGLPFDLRASVVDGDGRAVADADLFDPAAWRRYGWSVYREDVGRRLARRGDDTPYGSAADRDRFLALTLDRARRFQTLLARDAERFGETRYHAIQSRSFDTPARAALLPRGGDLQLAFADDAAVRRVPGLNRRLTDAGDRHASVASQQALSPQERRALADRTTFLDVPHRALAADPRTHAHLVDILATD